MLHQSQIIISCESITKHHGQLFIGQLRIAFNCTLIRVIYLILMQINRFLPIIRLRHMYDKHYLILDFYRVYVICRQYITIYLFRVVKLTPKFLHYFFDIVKPDNLKFLRKFLVIMLCNTKNNPSAMRIGKRRVSRPYIFWKSFPALFKLYIDILTLGNHINNFFRCKIFHKNKFSYFMANIRQFYIFAKRAT